MWRVILILIIPLCFSVAKAADPVTLSKCEDFLKSMKIAYTKGGTDRLAFKTGFADGKQYSMILVADPINKYVYMAVLDIMKLPPDSPKACQVAKKIAQLNYGMMLAKLEWDAKRGEVRLSVTLTTEDGLSKARFTAALSTLLSTAEQVEKELKILPK